MNTAKARKVVPETSKAALILVLTLFVIYPFARMMFGITSADFSKVVSSPIFYTAIKNSFLIAMITAILSLFLATLLSFSLQRSNVRGKEVFSLVFTLPMLVPSISLGTGLIVLFGNNGIITKLTNGITNSIYGFSGIVLGSVLYSFPVAFLMINDVLKYEDGSAYEAAEILGISKFKQFRIITFPYIRRSLIAAFFSVFTMVVTDYGVPLMLSGKIPTLAVMLYQEVLGQMNFGSGSVLGLFLLIPALAAFIYNLLSKPQAKMSYVTTTVNLRKNLFRDIASWTACILMSLFILCFLGAFVLFGFSYSFPKDMSLSLVHLNNAFSINGTMYLKNSLIIALMTAIVGTVVSFVDGYLTTRTTGVLSHVLHLFSITSLAIPGLVLGLAYVFAFKTSFIYGTYAILILVNTVHFFASPYLMVHNSLEKMNENIENVGLVLGISRIRIICRVVVPMSKSTIIEVFSYFFVNSMMTISAVSFLFAYNTKPLSMAIGQFEAQMQLQSAAIVSLVILFVNLLVKGTIKVIKNKLDKRINIVTSGVN